MYFSDVLFLIQIVFQSLIYADGFKIFAKDGIFTFMGDILKVNTHIELQHASDLCYLQ